MKSTLVCLVALCSLVGVLDASYNVFLPRSTHKYAYNMMVTTSTSSGDPQYAAVAFKIIATVDTPTDDRAVIKFENIRVAKVNDELRKTEVEDSKLEFKQIEEYTRNLSRPFEIKFKNGQIEKISFSQEDGFPSREMKKGFAQTLQLDLEGHDSHNALTRDSNKRPNFYRVMEPCLSGICETQYILKSLKDPACPNCKVLNVTKIRDYRNCEEKVHFVHSNHPSYKCSDCEDDASHPFSKNTIISLNLKWQDGNYLLENATANGIIKVSPLGEQSDQYFAEFTKDIELLSVRPLTNEIQAHTERSETLLSKMTERMEHAIQDPNRKDPISMPYALDTACHVEKVRNVLDEIANTIETDPSKIKWRSALSYVATSVKAFRECDFNQLDQIMTHVVGDSDRSSSYSQQRHYDSEQQRHYDSDSDHESQRRYDSQRRHEPLKSGSSSPDTKRSLYLDILAQTGTYPSLLMWKKYTLKQVISEERSIKFIQVFASHCLFPRPQILDTIWEVIKSDAIRQNEQLFSTIVMSYGTLVSRTCLKYKPYWQNVVEPEKLCPEPKKYLQPLVKLLEEVQSPQKQMALLNALGETRLRDAVMPLKKYATGDATDCDIIQTEAVIALGKCAKLHPSIAKDILYSIYYDVEEAPKVRIAALVGLFKTSLNRHALEKIAMFTWEEPDTTVGTFVVKSLEAIANSSHPCFSDISSHAEHALELINDDFDEGLPLVHNMFFEQELDEFDITSLLSTLYVSEGHPLTPKMMHVHYRPHVAGYDADVFRFSYFGQGTKSLVDQLIGPVAAFSDMNFEELLRSVDRSNPAVGLTDLAEKLGIKPREDDETKGVLKIALFGNQQRMFYYNKEKLVKLASSYSSSIWQKLQQGHEFNFQRTIMPLDINIITPTPVGLPCVFRVKSPVHYGVKGHLKINLDGSLSNIRGINVDMKLKPTVAMKMMYTFGIKVHQEKILAGAAYNTMAIIKPTIGGEFSVRKESDDQVSIQFKPVVPTKETTIVYYATHPMTFLHKYDSFKPIFENALPITFLEKPKENEYHLGPRKQSPIIVKLKQDTFWHNRGSIYDWVMRIADPSSLPLAFLTQSWKNRQYEVVYDPSVLSTQLQEVELKLNWKCDRADSQPQRRILRGVRGLLTYLLGWSATEDKCSSESSSQSKPWEMRHSKEFRPYAAKSFMRDNRNSDSSEEDSDEDSIWNQRRAKSSRSQYRDEDDSSEESYSSWNSQHRGSSYMDTMEYSRKHDSMYNDDRNVHTEGDADVRIVDAYKGESRLVVEAELTTRGSQSHKIQAKLVLKKQHEIPISTVDLVVNLPGREIQQICLKAKRQQSRQPCYYGGQLPSFLEKEIRSEFQMQWGQNCNSPLGHIDIKMVANKSREQQKYDPMPPTSDIKPWFYAQCERDLAKGIPYSDECITSMNHLARLNHVTFVAKYDKVPAAVRNITHQLKLAAVSWLYPYMSYNPIDIQNPEKTIKFVLDYHYDMPAVDLKVHTPYAKAFFAKLPYREVTRVLQAPNIRKSIWRKIANSLTDDGAFATAFVSGNTINTYDNQTYVYKQWGQCKHVLVMDCTTSNMFAVLNKPVGPSNKSLIVRILKHKIEIDATAAGSEREVVINGVPQRLSVEQRAYVYDKEFKQVVAYINKKTSHRYLVTLPQVGLRVRYDGYSTFTELSQIWQDKVCGVFGDFDNDFIYEYRGPKQCALIDGPEMAKSYAVPDGSCSAPRPSQNKLCETEDHRSRSSGISHNTGCSHKKTMKVTQQGKLCLSKYPVKVCNPGCSADEERQEDIPFTCMDQEDPRAYRVMRELSANRPIYDLSDRSTAFRKQISVPERCSP